MPSARHCWRNGTGIALQPRYAARWTCCAVPSSITRCLTAIDGVGPGVEAPDVALQVEVQTKYAGYLERQREEILRQQRNEHTPIPADFDYARVRGLSTEVLAKLQQARPVTVGQAMPASAASRRRPSRCCWCT